VLRREFFELADIAKSARRGPSAAVISPVALEAVRRIDALFEIERDAKGIPAHERLAVRRQRSTPLLADLKAWVCEQRAQLSRAAAVIQPNDYLLKRWDEFTRFTEDGRICMTNNAAERGLRGLALGRRAWLFAGSDRGADKAAVMITLITTCRLNHVDPQAWLADTSPASQGSRRIVCTNPCPGSGSGSTQLQPPPRPQPRTTDSRPPSRGHVIITRLSSDAYVKDMPVRMPQTRTRTSKKESKTGFLS
jgi:hypothetical protein